MSQNITKKPELLLPAGSLTRLKTAFLYGKVFLDGVTSLKTDAFRR
jgi:collagenase-like PrtC family protease